MSIESRSRRYGKVFDHWQIREFLGSGSSGKTAVFRLARSDSEWGTSALKVINLIEERGDINSMPDFRKKEYEQARRECSLNAEQEVRLMDDLRGNTNIVDYQDHTFIDWTDEDRFGRDLLIRMELLEDLYSEIQNGRIFGESEVLKIGKDICSALVLCHSKNILHRDVKPGNIFRNKDGNYKLGDFGVSRVLDACPGAIASTGIGTYEYWPAEQMTGRYDKRVDIYSLGLVLYELCNHNRLPFATTIYITGREVSMRLAGVPFPQLVDVNPTFSAVILKACAFDPDERYQSAEEFLEALNTVIPVLKDNSAQIPVSISRDDKWIGPEYSTLPAESVVYSMFKTVPASIDEKYIHESYSEEINAENTLATEQTEKDAWRDVMRNIIAENRKKILSVGITVIFFLLCLLAFSIGVLLAKTTGKNHIKVKSTVLETEYSVTETRSMTEEIIEKHDEFLTESEDIVSTGVEMTSETVDTSETVTIVSAEETLGIDSISGLDTSETDELEQQLPIYSVKYQYTGKVIRTSALNVREQPSTSSNKVTELEGGTSIVIYETTIAEKMAWGRCDLGWIYLYYVDLTPISQEFVDARLIGYDNTIIYTDANRSGVTDVYSKMTVVNIYEISGNMARTEQGWISLDNCL